MSANLYDIYEKVKDNYEDVTVSFFKPGRSLTFTDKDEHAIIVKYDKDYENIEEIYQKEYVYSRNMGEPIKNLRDEEMDLLFAEYLSSPLKPVLEDFLWGKNKNIHENTVETEKEEIEEDIER